MSFTGFSTVDAISLVPGLVGTRLFGGNRFNIQFCDTRVWGVTAVLV